MCGLKTVGDRSDLVPEVSYLFEANGDSRLSRARFQLLACWCRGRCCSVYCHMNVAKSQHSLQVQITTNADAHFENSLPQPSCILCVKV